MGSGEASAAAVSCQRTRPRPRVKWPLGSVASSRVCAHMAALSGRATWSSSHSVISRHHTEMSSGLCPQVRETASQRGSARPETSPACVIPSRMDCFTCQEAPHGQCAEIASATAVAHRHRSARDCAPHRRTAHPSDMRAASTAQSVRGLSSTCALVRFLQWRVRHTAVFEVGPSMRHSRNAEPAEGLVSGGRRLTRRRTWPKRAGARHAVQPAHVGSTSHSIPSSWCPSATREDASE